MLLNCCKYPQGHVAACQLRGLRRPNPPRSTVHLCSPPSQQALVSVGALIGSARALVVEWSSGFELFQ